MNIHTTVNVRAIGAVRAVCAIPAVLTGLTMVSLLAGSPALAHIDPYPSAGAHPRVTAPDHEPKDETAPIVERTVAFNDFTLTTPAGQPFNLREYASGKELTLICFVAGWCKNSNHNGHVIKRLYDKYKDRGLGAVVVMEYSNNRDIQIHVNRIGIDYPVVVETDALGARKKSLHYKYRHAVGDKREWGTPFYVLIDRRDIKPEPTTSPLADHVYTVSGEIAESEAEQFIKDHLVVLGGSPGSSGALVLPCGLRAYQGAATEGRPYISLTI